MMKIQDLKSSPGLLIALAAVILPFTVPLIFLLFPVFALGALYWLAAYNTTRNNDAAVEINANAIPRGLASENEEPISIAAKASTQPKPSPSAVVNNNSTESNGAGSAAAPTKTPPPDTTIPSTSPKPAAEAPAPLPGPKAVGGAAILAKLKAQKAARAAAEAEAKSEQAKQKGLTILYASQLGTAAEIAKNIHAEAESREIKSHVAAMNDFGFDNISAEKTPVVIIVASSTGDGDAPDNSSKFYAEVRRRSNAEDRLAGVSFTCLGLGDSNYTRYMAVPRVFKNRFLEMGATTFYDPIEADEVDGLEEIVDDWISKLWAAVAVAIEDKNNNKNNNSENGNAESAPGGVEDEVLLKKESSTSSAIKVENGDLQGVPALPKLRIALHWEDEATAAAVRAAEKSGPSPEQLSYKENASSLSSATGNDDVDTESNGLYSPDQPFWATITDAKLLTSSFENSVVAPITTATTSTTTATADKLITEESDFDRRVLHMEVDISGSGMETLYKPGDSIGIVPENNPGMVDEIISRLGVDPDAVFSVTEPGVDSSDTVAINTTTSTNNVSNGVPGEKLLSHLKWPCTVRNAFLRGCDLTTAPRKSLLRVLAEHCSNNEEKQRLLFLCSRQGRDSYATEILSARPSLLDLLTMFPSCKPPLDALLDALPALPPRMYSITCSPLCSPNKIQVAFTIVKYSTTSYDRTSSPNGTSSTIASHTVASQIQREGVATTWLDRLCTPFLSKTSNTTSSSSIPSSVATPSVRVPIFLRRGGAFKTPSDLDRPWIMIGPGTGVAPFRGFLQERRARIQAVNNAENNGTDDGGAAAVGECWLYFGCRRPDLDFLYESDLKSFQQDGTLTRLEVAFSRVNNSATSVENKKVYVQHLMAQQSEELYKLFIEKKGTVFVCGDGANMAKDVHATLISIIAKGGNVSEAEAAVQLTTLAKEGRYVRDIWS